MPDIDVTTTLFAQALSRSVENLTVISNSLGVLGALAGHIDARLILCPGDYSRRERAVFGAETLAFLNKFNVDAAYIGASGLMAEGSVDVETDACWVKRTMIARAKSSVLLASASKFGRPHFEVISPWKQIDLLVTDRRPPGEWQENLRRSDVEIRFPDQSG